MKLFLLFFGSIFIFGCTHPTLSCSIKQIHGTKQASYPTIDCDEGDC